MSGFRIIYGLPKKNKDKQEINMKCVKSKAGKIARVNDTVAEKRVSGGGWSYCGKEEWKKEVRGPVVPDATDPESV